MNTPANRAGAGLASIANALLNHEIIEPEGFSVLQRLSQELKSAREALDWTIEVDRGEPILFKRTIDETGRCVRPCIIAKRIRVEQGDDDMSPFRLLDMALEVTDDSSKPLCRWHVDVANKQGDTYQSGPITHLQFGGHHHNAGEHDHPLKVPRWCHPPMEVALLCEVVAANFYEKIWMEMRGEPGWCNAISIFQKLCYTHYSRRMAESLNVSSTTMLNNAWARV